MTIDNLIKALGWSLVHSIWQGALVAFFLCIALGLLHRSSANSRYAAAFVALLVMAILPVATTCEMMGSTGGSIVIGPTSASPGANMASQTAGGAVQSAAVEPLTLQAMAGMIEPYLPVIFQVWFAGLLVMTLWNLAGWLRVRRMVTREVSPAPDFWLDRMTPLKRMAGIVREVKLLESARAAGPLVVGMIKPVILVPTSLLTGLSMPEVDAILAHELAHVRRHDYAANIVQMAIVTILFYHPAVWWISRRLRIERENCCDDFAVNLCGSKIKYARSLVALHELYAGATAGMTAPALPARDERLLKRVKRIMGREEPRANGTAIALSALLIMGAALLCVHCNSHADAAPPSPDKARMMGYVEDFFMNNYRDITARKSLEWGDPEVQANGNISIRYKCLATIWDKDKMIFNQVFTFTPAGKFVTTEDVPGFPQKEKPPDVTTHDGMMELVEEFFQNNWRDIASHKFIESDEPVRHENGNTSIRVKFEAETRDGTKTMNKIFTFDSQGKFVSVEDVPQEESKTVAPTLAPPTDIATPEQTVAGFMRAAMAGNVAQAQSYFVPGGKDYGDIKEALGSAEFKAMLDAIDPDVPIKVTEKKEMPGSMTVVWRVTFKKEVSLGGQTMKPGSTYDLDATLKKLEQGWLIENM